MEEVVIFSCRECSRTLPAPTAFLERMHQIQPAEGCQIGGGRDGDEHHRLSDLKTKIINLVVQNSFSFSLSPRFLSLLTRITETYPEFSVPRGLCMLDHREE